MSTCCYGLIVQEPSTTKNSSSSRAPKTGAQLRDNPEEREKCGKPPKTPITAAIPNTAGSCVPVSVHDSGGELNLRHLYC